MKKGKVLGKSQLVLAVMIVALGAAVWLNMRYQPNENKYLGEAEFVDGAADSESLETSANAEDYFTKSRRERTEQRAEIKEELAETIKSAGDNADVIKTAVDKAASIAARQTAEGNIETLLKAKGFTEALAIIGDSDINIVVKADSLSAAQTLQIQDVAKAQSGYTVDKIKILTVK
ncbi:MAG: SpoIIIAH-like family protein [Ruminococcaceae bacterium]|nr:SpoIIIAH-like family protein [Oscillospiraceae bacterium]